MVGLASKAETGFFGLRAPLSEGVRSLHKSCGFLRLLVLKLTWGLSVDELLLILSLASGLQGIIAEVQLLQLFVNILNDTHSSSFGQPIVHECYLFYSRTVQRLTQSLRLLIS